MVECIQQNSKGNWFERDVEQQKGKGRVGISWSDGKNKYNAQFDKTIGLGGFGDIRDIVEAVGECSRGGGHKMWIDFEQGGEDKKFPSWRNSRKNSKEVGGIE